MEESPSPSSPSNSFHSSSSSRSDRSVFSPLFERFKNATSLQTQEKRPKNKNQGKPSLVTTLRSKIKNMFKETSEETYYILELRNLKVIGNFPGFNNHLYLTFDVSDQQHLTDPVEYLEKKAEWNEVIKIEIKSVDTIVKIKVKSVKKENESKDSEIASIDFSLKHLLLNKEEEISFSFYKLTSSKLTFTALFAQRIISPESSLTDFSEMKHSKHEKEFSSYSGFPVMEHEQNTSKHTYSIQSPTLTKSTKDASSESVESDYGKALYITDASSNSSQIWKENKTNTQASFESSSDYQTEYNEISGVLLSASPQKRNSLHSQRVREDWEIPYSELLIKQQIGRGSYGVVYLAQWRGQEVAVKQLNSSIVTAAEREDYLAEIELMKHLRPHANVVTLIGVCTKDSLCLVTEYQPKGSLRTYLDTNAKIELPDIIKFCLDICAGMLHLHAERLIHGDLAARNLLFDENDNLRVADFGASLKLAPNESEKIKKNEFGPLKWMSPEAIHGKHTLKSDVWSFGIVLIEIFTRQVPFPNADIEQVAYSIGQLGKGHPIPKIVPRHFVEIMDSCWQFNEVDRPSFTKLHRMFSRLKNPSILPYSYSEVHLLDEWEINYESLKFEHQLGSGNFGSVYYGLWRAQPVAIKVFKTKSKLSQSAIEQFSSEAKIMKELRPHRNLVGLLGVCMSLSQPLCLVFEHQPNGTLRDLLDNSSKQITTKMIVKWVRDISAGMLHLHAEGIIHNDLAARNLLFDINMALRIGDFGLSRIIPPEVDIGEEHMGSPVGPLKWMAPEALARKSCLKSDVWSFGIVLIEIFTRNLPYPDMDKKTVANKVLNEKFKPELPGTGIHSTLRSILTRCLEYEPEKRPSFQEIYKIIGRLKLHFSTKNFSRINSDSV